MLVRGIKHYCVGSNLMVGGQAWVILYWDNYHLGRNKRQGYLEVKLWEAGTVA